MLEDVFSARWETEENKNISGVRFQFVPKNMSTVRSTLTSVAMVLVAVSAAPAQAATDALGCVATYHSVNPTSCKTLGNLAFCLADAEEEGQDVGGFMMIWEGFLPYV